MRILIVNAVSYMGGAEEWILHLIRGLAPRDHVIEVAHHPATPLGARALEAGASRTWSPANGFRGVVRSALSLAGGIREGDYDVVVSTSHLKIAGMAARLAGHPGIVARLNSGWSSDDPVRRAGAEWRRHRWYHRRFVQLAATNSVAGKADLVARDFLPPERIVVIHNGVDLERFDPDRVPRGRFRAALGVPVDGQLVVSVARFAPDRAREAEVEAMGRLVAARPGVHVAFIGSCGFRDEPFRARLVALANAFPGGDRIHFLEPRDDVPEVLADADLLLRVMSTEGLANVALEAMAMRVPVVAAAISGMPEAVVDGQTGRLVAPGDADAIERAVAELLEAPLERRRAMGEAGRARAEVRFSLDRMADSYEELFERALAERREA